MQVYSAPSMFKCTNTIARWSKSNKELYFLMDTFPVANNESICTGQFSKQMCSCAKGPWCSVSLSVTVILRVCFCFLRTRLLTPFKGFLNCPLFYLKSIFEVEKRHLSLPGHSWDNLLLCFCCLLMYSLRCLCCVKANILFPIGDPLL